MPKLITQQFIEKSATSKNSALHTISDTQICKICKIDKPKSEFNRRSDYKNGIAKICKVCFNNDYRRAYSRAMYNKHRNKRIKKALENYFANHEVNKAKHRKWKSENKNHCNEYSKNYWENLDKTKKAEILEIKRKSAKSGVWPSQKFYNSKEYKNSRHKYRYANDINYRIKHILRDRLKMALRDNYKKGHTIDLLGCSIDFLKSHLQQTAINNGYKDFNINNYDGSHYNIDHIIPCSAFNIKCGYHQKLCFNWSNLQILDSKTNSLKSNKFYNMAA